jgi:hypothetical protein
MQFTHRLLIGFLILSAGSATPSLAQRRRNVAADAPQVKLVAPLGVIPGQPVTIAIRGLKLDTATEIRFPDAKLPIGVTIKKKEKVAVPQKLTPQLAGDTQVEAELTIPAEMPAGVISFVVVTPAGECPPHELVLLDRKSTVAEQEPNDGFDKAQEIQPGQTVVGAIHQPQNVDVFKLTGKAGDKVTIEVQAARYGSALDPVLMIANARGQILTVADDRPEDADAVVEVTLPADGPVFISVLDAHDLGGPAHPYLLVVRSKLP